jgi:hypothetical protein
MTVHETLVRDAVDAAASGAKARRRERLRTQNRVVLAPREQASSSWGANASRGRWWQKPDTRESAA